MDKSCDQCRWDEGPVFDDDGDCIKPCHDCDYGEESNYSEFEPKEL